MRYVSMVFFLLITEVGFCSNRNPIVGPPGPQGIQGNPGTDGNDFDFKTRYIGEIGLRIFDDKNLSINVFDGYDFREGRNDSVGLRTLFKIGESYEEKESKALKKNLDELRKRLWKLEKKNMCEE